MTDSQTNIIIPFGLLPRGGDWFLPDASCEECADITKRFEGFCQQAMLGNLRYRMNLKSRRKRKREVSIKFLHDDGKLHEHTISVANAPRICIGFNWAAAGLLQGLPPSDIFYGNDVIRYAVGDVEQYETSNARKLHIGSVSPLAFARMLAKISHCYIIAEYGADFFRPLLTDLILGKKSAKAPYLVF